MLLRYALLQQEMRCLAVLSPNSLSEVHEDKVTNLSFDKVHEQTLHPPIRVALDHRRVPGNFSREANWIDHSLLPSRMQSHDTLALISAGYQGTYLIVLDSKAYEDANAIANC